MKRRVFAAVLAGLKLSVFFAGCGKTENPRTGETTTAETTAAEDPIAGGWSEERIITDEEIAMFGEALKDTVGLYIPNVVATQVVAGTNYRFAAAQHVDASGTSLPFAQDVYVYIFKPLEGPAELVNIENLAEG